MNEPVKHFDLVPRSAGFDASRYEVPHPEPFLVDVRVGRHHLSDVVDHVSNVEYVRWLDRAAELHSDSVGYTRRGLVDEGMMWFVVRHEIDYLAEVWRGEELVVATWVGDMKRTTSWRGYAVIRPRDETMVCRAATLWVLVDLPTRRPRRIPGEMAQRFAPLEAISHGLASERAEGAGQRCTWR